MGKPACYNRPAYRDTLTVPDGWTKDGRRRMVEVPNAMSRGCQQWGEYGLARIENWDCVGCVWKP